MLSIVIIIVSMIAASKQFQTDFLTNVFIGVAEFGLFIAIGWLPWWLLLLPGILVSLLMGKKIADLVQGSGDSES
jgi:divalent metal cation (Fe/Co/Zn/Cd) transporter